MRAGTGVLVTIDARCTACGICIVACPERALRPAPLRPAVIATRLVDCESCMSCIEVCPVGAVTLGLAER